MKIQFSYPMNPDGSGRFGKPEQQYADLPTVPRAGDDVIVGGGCFYVRRVTWYPFGDAVEEIHEPLVYISLRWAADRP